MPTIFDAVSSGQSATSPLTVPHTVGAGADPVLVSAVLTRNVFQGDALSSVLFDGAAMVRHIERVVGGGEWRLYLYKLAAPMQGASGDVVATAAPINSISIVNISALAADQDDILGAAVGGNAVGEASLVTVIDGLLNGLLIDNHMVFSGRDPVADANQTERGEEIHAQIRQNVSTKDASDGAGMGWSWSGSAVWSMVAAAIKAAPLRPRQAISLARQKTASIILSGGNFS